MIGAQVGHASSSGLPTPGAAGSLVTVNYTALGNEADPFYVPIGVTMDSAAYTVVGPSVATGTVPVLNLPTAGAARTTTQFHVAGFAPLDAGQVLTFLVVGA